MPRGIWKRERTPLSPEHKKSLSISHLGYKQTPEHIAKRCKKHNQETKDKIRFAKLGDKNPMWSGDKIGYSALHSWIKRRLVKPDICPRCQERPAYDLANKGIYDRNLENWEWLCRRCHMEQDGRLKVFNRYRLDYNSTRKGGIKNGFSMQSM